MLPPAETPLQETARRPAALQRRQAAPRQTVPVHQPRQLEHAKQNVTTPVTTATIPTQQETETETTETAETEHRAAEAPTRNA